MFLRPRTLPRRLRHTVPSDQSLPTILRAAVGSREHDGFRVVARKESERVRLYSRFEKRVSPERTRAMVSTSV
jgi:ATP-dependent DNA ligase